MLRRHIPNELVIMGSDADVASLLTRAAQEGTAVQEQGHLTAGTLKLSHVTHGDPDNLSMARRLAQWGWSGGQKVTVEPNCAMGNPFDYDGNPFDYDGNPFDYDGNPFDYDGNPFDYDGNPNQTTTGDYPRVIGIGATSAEGQALFWGQPAFRQIGLTDVTGQRLPALELYQGEGVLAGIFDTAPKGEVNQPWLTIHRSQTPLHSVHGPNAPDYSDHGLMNASLVHAVAPQAKVHLYEVLAQDVSGDNYTLLAALLDFIVMAQGRRAVINLSLGAVCQRTGPSPALKYVLKMATDQGIVVCAAAGNRGQSARKVCDVPAAQVPAALTNVIAVAACNIGDKRASYTHQGDLAAPGGEDVGARGPGDADDIIGMGTSSLSGYVAMDAGTSFSTPLATGAAALLLGNGLPIGPDTQAQVLAALKAGARPAAGNVSTLEGCGLGAGILSITGALGIL